MASRPVTTNEDQPKIDEEPNRSADSAQKRRTN